MGSDGGHVISVHAFYSKNPGLNSTDYLIVDMERLK